MEAGVVTTGLSYKSLLPKKQHHALPTAEWDHHPAPGRPEALHGEPRHSYPACWLRSSWALASKSLVRLLLKSRRPGEEGGAVFRLSSGGPCRLSEPGHSGEPGRVGSGQGHWVGQDRFWFPLGLSGLFYSKFLCGPHTRIFVNCFQCSLVNKLQFVTLLFCLFYLFPT